MKLGFIGIGNMGLPMATNLLRAGHSLVVFDIREESYRSLLSMGAEASQSPAEVARSADIVFTSLPGPREVESVAAGPGGLLEGIGPGKIFVDLSTNSPTLVRNLHRAFLERGAEMLDAPVSGGIAGARKAALSIMVGGNRKAFEQVRPTLAALGDKISYIGEIGAGSVAKLVHNLVSICTTQVLAEAFTLGVKAGVGAEAVLEAIQNGAFGQGMLLNAMIPKMVLRGNFDRAAFALRLARKDLSLATELARELDFPAPIASYVEQELVAAVTRGLGDKDSSAVFLVQEERAGVKVRSEGAVQAKAS